MPFHHQKRLLELIFLLVALSLPDGVRYNNPRWLVEGWQCAFLNQDLLPKMLFLHANTLHLDGSSKVSLWYPPHLSFAEKIPVLYLRPALVTSPFLWKRSLRIRFGRDIYLPSKNIYSLSGGSLPLPVRIPTIPPSRIDQSSQTFPPFGREVRMPHNEYVLII